MQYTYPAKINGRFVPHVSFVPNRYVLQLIRRLPYFKNIKALNLTGNVKYLTFKGMQPVH